MEAQKTRAFYLQELRPNSCSNASRPGLELASPSSEVWPESCYSWFAVCSLAPAQAAVSDRIGTLRDSAGARDTWMISLMSKSCVALSRTRPLSLSFSCLHCVFVSRTRPLSSSSLCLARCVDRVRVLSLYPLCPATLCRRTLRSVRDSKGIALSWSSSVWAPRNNLRDFPRGPS